VVKKWTLALLSFLFFLAHPWSFQAWAEVCETAIALQGSPLSFQAWAEAKHFLAQSDKYRFLLYLGNPNFCQSVLYKAVTLL